MGDREVAVYMVIVTSYFTRLSRISIACKCLFKIKLSATKVNGFQCKAVTTKSSILDIADVSDQPLITISGRSYLYDNYNIIFYQRRI